MTETKKNPLISIIVPIYNVKDYVCKCIESIRQQTYNNIEIILVDDGSTDGSGEICDRYAASDSRIVVIHKENGGLSDARNCGIDRCRGELLGFVDGDDWIHPQMYEIMLSKMQKTKADLVTCQYAREDEDAFCRPISDEKITKKIFTGTEAMINLYIPSVMAWNKLYRRELFENLRYPVGRFHEDEFVIHRILRRCKSVCTLDIPLYFYTVRNGSIVSSVSERKIDDVLAALKDRVEFAVESDWNEVVHGSINGYCDYCIYRYLQIKNGELKLPDSLLEKLRKSEVDMCKQYPHVKIKKRYRKFAISPEKYEKYVKFEDRKKKITNLALLLPRKIRRLFK